MCTDDGDIAGLRVGVVYGDVLLDSESRPVGIAIRCCRHIVARVGAVDRVVDDTIVLHLDGDVDEAKR